MVEFADDLMGLYFRMLYEEHMEENEYKRHLLNHMTYSHAYLSGAAVELSDANPVALCEAAMHAAACAWCLADYHAEKRPAEPIPYEAWEGIANRWIKAVEKWSKYVGSNRAAAYAAPIRERNALKDFPPLNGQQGESVSGTQTDITSSLGTAIDTGWLASGMPSSGPITGSGSAAASDRTTRAGSQAPKRSHKRKPEAPTQRGS